MNFNMTVTKTENGKTTTTHHSSAHGTSVTTTGSAFAPPHSPHAPPHSPHAPPPANHSPISPHAPPHAAIPTIPSVFVIDHNFSAFVLASTAITPGTKFHAVQAVDKIVINTPIIQLPNTDLALIAPVIEVLCPVQINLSGTNGRDYMHNPQVGTMHGENGTDGGNLMLCTGTVLGNNFITFISRGGNGGAAAPPSQPAPPPGSVGDFIYRPPTFVFKSDHCSSNLGSNRDVVSRMNEPRKNSEGNWHQMNCDTLMTSLKELMKAYNRKTTDKSFVLNQRLLNADTSFTKTQVENVINPWSLRNSYEASDASREKEYQEKLQQALASGQAHPPLPTYQRREYPVNAISDKAFFAWEPNPNVAPMMFTAFSPGLFKYRKFKMSFVRFQHDKLQNTFTASFDPSLPSNNEQYSSDEIKATQQRPARIVMDGDFRDVSLDKHPSHVINQAWIISNKSNTGPTGGGFGGRAGKAGQYLQYKLPPHAFKMDFRQDLQHKFAIIHKSPMYPQSPAEPSRKLFPELTQYHPTSDNEMAQNLFKHFRWYNITGSPQGNKPLVVDIAPGQPGYNYASPDTALIFATTGGSEGTCFLYEAYRYHP